MTPTAKYEVVSDVNGALEFVNRFYGLPRSSNMQGIVNKKDGETIGAVVFEDFNGTNVFMHVAGKPGKKWVTKEFLYWTFAYPFEQLKCRRVTGTVNADNLEARKFNEHLGFKLECTLKEAGPKGQDVLVYVMFRDDCRYGTNDLRKRRAG